MRNFYTTLVTISLAAVSQAQPESKLFFEQLQKGNFSTKATRKLPNPKEVQEKISLTAKDVKSDKPKAESKYSTSSDYRRVLEFDADWEAYNNRPYVKAWNVVQLLHESKDLRSERILILRDIKASPAAQIMPSNNTASKYFSRLALVDLTLGNFSEAYYAAQMDLDLIGNIRVPMDQVTSIYVAIICREELGVGTTGAMDFVRGVNRRDTLWGEFRSEDEMRYFPTDGSSRAIEFGCYINLQGHMQDFAYQNVCANRALNLYPTNPIAVHYFCFTKGNLNDPKLQALAKSVADKLPPGPMRKKFDWAYPEEYLRKLEAERKKAAGG